jgi:NAD(P)-dependent dehydrogenase (short-subunit alcohol dehydrogenase family)
MAVHTEELAVARIGLDRNTFARQTAVVTGAGRGIGREVARAFAWLGACVVIAEISDEGQETEQIIRKAGSQAIFVRTDVSEPGDVARLAASAHQAFGRVDILVNNAILCPVASVLEMDVALWDRVLAVNLRGAFLTCKQFLPEMLSKGRGVIINMISTDAMPNLSAYIASKQGIAAFSQSLAAEVGQEGVRVIAFAPGFVDTPGLRGAAKDLAPRLGISAQEFMHLPLHPAYSQSAMPAGHAAAATAYLAAVLADEYHGEQVTGYSVLERAGFIQAAGTAAPAQPEPVEPPLAAVETEIENGHDRQAQIQRALALCVQLQQAILETGEEFNKLPIFVRPMARAGFKNKSGHSLQDWVANLASLRGQLEKLETGDAAASEALRAGVRSLGQRLDQLAGYYRQVPEETGRFSRDQAFLQEVARTSTWRVRRIGELKALLAMIAGLK